MSQAKTSSQNESHGPLTALPPFDNAKQTADAVLRSSDNVSFYVHQRILFEASSALEQKLSPGPSSDSKKRKRGEDADISYTENGTVVLAVPAPGRVVRHFLVYLYPMCRPDVPVKYTCGVRQLAILYDVQYIKEAVEDTFAAHAKRDPAYAYAAAIASSWEKGARIAARESLTRPMLTEAPASMDRISSAHVRRYQEYHKNCVAAAAAAVSWDTDGKLTLTQPDQPSKNWCWFGCMYHNRAVMVQVGGQERAASRWWKGAVEGLEDTLQVSPSKAAIVDCSLARNLAQESVVKCCSSCRTNAALDLMEFASVLGDEVERMVSKVALVYQATSTAAS